MDQAYFNLGRDKNRCWVSTKEEEDTQAPKLTKREEKISVGVVAAISLNGKSALGFLPKNWAAPDLVNVFKDTVYPSFHWSNRLGHENELMRDNDGRHQTQVWKEYEAQVHLRPILPWPANSPDVAPIENAWAWMKAFVEHQAPTDEPSLRQAIIDAWEALPQQMVVKLMQSIPKRLRMVIKHNGGRSGY
jgi:hypothetical protein